MTPGRIVITVALGLASLTIGVVGAQALGGSAVEPLGPADLTRGIAIEAPSAEVEDPIELLAPMVSTDDERAALVEEVGLTDEVDILESPRTPESEAIGLIRPTTAFPEIGAQPDGEVEDEESQAPPPTGFYIPALQLFIPQEPQAIDPCAGLDEGSEPSRSCPPGIGSTILAATQRFSAGTIIDGHVVTGDALVSRCPSGHPESADGTTGVTLFTTAPLVAAEVLYRPIELVQPDLRTPAAPWTPLSLPNPAHDGFVSQWSAAITEVGVGPATAFCFDLPRDPDTPYEITATVTDIFDNTYVLPETVIPSQDPGARPLTTVTRDGNLVTVSAWSVEGADVIFNVARVTGGRERPDCTQPGFPQVGDDGFGSRWTRRNQTPLPIGVADPDFTWRHDATFGVYAGNDAVVCITILNSDNPFDVLTEEQLVIGSHGAWIPHITMLAQGVDIPKGLIWDFLDVCGDRRILAGQSIEMWRCGAHDLNRPFAVDSGRSYGVTVRIEKWLDGQPELEHIRTFTRRVEFRVCPAKCASPAKFQFFRIIVPDGDVRFITFYDWRDGTLLFDGPTWRFVGESDLEPAGRIEFDSASQHETDVQTGAVTTDITFFSNLPSTLTGASLSVLEEGFDGVTPCGTEGPIAIPAGGESSAKHSFRLDGLCLGTFYGVAAEFLDEGGSPTTTHHFFVTPHLLGVYDMTVELITDSHRSLEITDVAALIEDHQRPFVFDGFGTINSQTNRFSPGRVPDRTCHPVTAGSADLVSWSGEAMFEEQSVAYLEARGPSLDFSLTFANPRVGSGTACDQPSPHPGPYTVSASIPVASLNSVDENGLPSANTFVIERTVADGLTVRMTLRPIGTNWVSREQ